MINSKEELENYVANLSGILHLFASETQKLVVSFRTIVGNIYNYGKSRYGNFDGTIIPLDIESLSSTCDDLNFQWNVVAPLAEEIKRLIENEFEAESETALVDLSSLITKMDVFFKELLSSESNFSDKATYNRSATELKHFETVFPQITLKLLSLIKKDVSEHLTKKTTQYKDLRHRKSIRRSPSRPTTSSDTTSSTAIFPSQSMPSMRSHSASAELGNEEKTLASEPKAVEKSPKKIDTIQEQPEPVLMEVKTVQQPQTVIATATVQTLPQPASPSIIPRKEASKLKAAAFASNLQEKEQIKNKVGFFEEQIHVASGDAIDKNKMKDKSVGSSGNAPPALPKIPPKPTKFQIPRHLLDQTSASDSHAKSSPRVSPKQVDENATSLEEALSEVTGKTEKAIGYDIIRQPADVPAPPSTTQIIDQEEQGGPSLIAQIALSSSPKLPEPRLVEAAKKPLSGSQQRLAESHGGSVKSSSPRVAAAMKSLGQFFADAPPLRVASTDKEPLRARAQSKPSSLSALDRSSDALSDGARPHSGQASDGVSIVPLKPAVSPRVSQLIADETGKKSRKRSSFYPDGYKVPTEEEDRHFVATLPVAETHEIVFQAVNGYQLLPTASPQFPYMRIILGTTARLGRSNTQKHPNFITMSMSQVISRNHLDLWFEDKGDQGQFWIKDCGSNSGTWLNGQRLSDAGCVSVPVSVKTGDIIRLGSDYKATQATTDEDVRDVRHKCIIARLVCRTPSSLNAVPNIPRSTSIESSLSTPNSVSNSVSKAVTREINPQSSSSEMPIGLHPSVYKLQKEVEAKKAQQKKLFKEEIGKLEERLELTRKQSGPQYISNGATSSTVIDTVESMSRSTPNLNEAFTSMPRQSASVIHALKDKLDPNEKSTKYFISFTATTLPFRIKKVSIHPGFSLSQRQGPEDDITDLGPEMMDIQFKSWGNSKDHKQRFVLHDYRLTDPNNPNIGTMVEVIRDDTNPFNYSVVLTTGNVGNDGNRGSQSMSVLMAQIDFSSDMRCKIAPCFQPLKNHVPCSELVLPEPLRLPKTSQPPNSTLRREKSVIRDDSNVTPIYLINNVPAPDNQFPSMVIMGNFNDPSNSQSFFQNLSTSLHNLAISDESLSKSNMMIVLKEMLPSRSQKLLGEIRGKQGLKRGVRETKWHYELEVVEGTLMEYMSRCGGTEWNDFVKLQQTSDDDTNFDSVQWVYRNEWWSLVLLASASLGFLKDS